MRVPLDKGEGREWPTLSPLVLAKCGCWTLKPGSNTSAARYFGCSRRTNYRASINRIQRIAGEQNASEHFRSI